MASVVQGLMLSHGRIVEYLAEYMVVAGGGGRQAFYYGAGGGAGGALSGTVLLSSGRVYTLQIGAGGSTSTGSNSYLSEPNANINILAYGGGAGGGGNGGSGGGGVVGAGGPGTGGPGGLGVPGQGTNGETGNYYGNARCPDDPFYFRCNDDAPPAKGGAKNEVSSITGSAVTYAPSSPTSSSSGAANTGQGGYGVRTDSGVYPGGSGVIVLALPNQGVALNVSAGLTYEVINSRSNYTVYRFTGGLGTITL